MCTLERAMLSNLKLVPCCFKFAPKCCHRLLNIQLHFSLENDLFDVDHLFVQELTNLLKICCIHLIL